MDYCRKHQIFVVESGETVTLEVSKSAGEYLASFSALSVADGSGVPWELVMPSGQSPGTTEIRRFRAPVTLGAALSFTLAFGYAAPGESYSVSFPGSKYPAESIEYPRMVRVYSFSVGPISCHCNECGAIAEGATSGDRCKVCTGTFVCHRF